jgi:NADPH-dependent 2,4-dienoyl-CoA reductase/sulfur reductase-like enzyme
MSDRFVIVGGDAAGMSAASKAKRDDPDLDVVVFEKGQWVSYAACGMPYYVKGEIDDLDDLVAITAEEFREERDVDVRTGHEVVGIDPEEKTVAVEADGETLTEPYDHLLYATGAHAIEPPFEGMDLPGVFTLHSMDAAAEVKSYLETEVGAGGSDADSPAPAQGDESGGGRPNVAVIGGGYVGVEMAEAFSAYDATVHLFEMLPHVLQPFGEAVADRVEDHLRERGVELHLETTVEGFAGDGRLETIRTEAEEFPVDMAVVGVGVAPNVSLAEAAGIELGPTGAIATDEYGRTNLPDVYAAGDCAEARHVVTGDPDYVPLALTANRAGRAIGQTVVGDPTPVGETAGTATVKAFDLEAARTGVVDEERAREAGFDPVSVTITDSSRAHYYPGAEEIRVTLVADRDSRRVLGATVVGEDRAAKRVDTVATALHADMTVDDVEYLDLAYAPPFGPVWDPVLTAARVLGGKLPE